MIIATDWFDEAALLTPRDELSTAYGEVRSYSRDTGAIRHRPCLVEAISEALVG